MAFKLEGLCLASQNSVRRTWHYTTTDAKAVVDSADYFKPVIDRIAKNDIIVATTSTGGTPIITNYFVNSNDGTTIDVNDGTDISSTTDTD